MILCANKKYELILKLLYDTGMRVNELTNLKLPESNLKGVRQSRLQPTLIIACLDS